MMLNVTNVEREREREESACRKVMFDECSEIQPLDLLATL